MQNAVPACQEAIQLCQEVPETCVLAIDICNLALLEPYTLTGMNPYDMRIKCAKPPLCYDFSNVGRFLARAEVMSYLGVTKEWQDCNRGVTLLFELSGDWMQSFQDQLPDQLANDIPVLIYAGDQDYICNHLGNLAWASVLEWPHQQEWNNTNMTNWMVDGQRAGAIKTGFGFTFLKVNDAGHMVPMDQPKNALAMVNAFLDGSLTQ